MDAQLAQRVSRLAYALKASGAASDNKEAYEMAIEMLKKKDAAAANANTDTNAVSISSNILTNNNSRTTADSNSRTNADGNNGVFLGKDSLGFEMKGKTLKELAAEDAAKRER